MGYEYDSNVMMVMASILCRIVHCALCCTRVHRHKYDTYLAYPDFNASILIGDKASLVTPFGLMHEKTCL